MRFHNRTLSKEINGAIIKANELLQHDSPMMKDILLKDDFKFNSGLGIEVHGKIVNCKTIAPVYFYKPFNRFTSSMGYSDGKAIHLNSRKFNAFRFNDLVGLLVHEYLHLCGLSHGNNYKTAEKVLFSVNYFCSEGISKGRWL